MRCIVAIDDTDSSLGACTTYLGYRVAVDLSPRVRVLPYPRLVRLNPNIPFKTRGNAAVCLEVEVEEPDEAFELLASKVTELSDVEGGANSGMVFLEDTREAIDFAPLYRRALTGVVNPGSVRRFLRENGVRTFELGNGMGVVGAAASVGFTAAMDHTFELIAYRRPGNWGTRRSVEPASVVEMDRMTFPRTYNNFDYQKSKVLVSPHGPDPVFAGVRGDSPATVLAAFGMLRYEEALAGHMVYMSNQHTDAHLQDELTWKGYSSGWVEGKVTSVRVGAGGHVYFELDTGMGKQKVAAYEPTGDLRRTAKLLSDGDVVRAYGGVRRASKVNPAILNLEKLDVISVRRGSPLMRGTYISSPRANRHLTRPFSRYGVVDTSRPGTVDGWLSAGPIPQKVPAGSQPRGPRGLLSQSTP